MLTSMLCLQAAPMTLLTSFRALSPLFCLVVEQFYPNPLRVSVTMVASIVVMVASMLLYTSHLNFAQLAGVGWALLNNLFAVGDKLLRRYFLGADQNPVDISVTAATLLSNVVAAAAWRGR